CLVGGRSRDHLCFAPDGDERIQPLSLHAQRERMLIIMANSATEMIFTPRWYTVAQVAQLLNYGESKVRVLIITGQLRSIKDGRSRRILSEWVEDYVQDRAKAAEDIWRRVAEPTEKLRTGKGRPSGAPRHGTVLCRRAVLSSGWLT